MDLGWLLDPHIQRHLLHDDGEVVVDEVKRHWFAYLRAGAECVAGLGLLIFSLLVPASAAWLPLVLALGVLAHAAWLGLRESRDGSSKIFGGSEVFRASCTAV